MPTTVTVGSGLDYASIAAAVTGLETAGADEHNFSTGGIAKISVEDSFEDTSVVEVDEGNFTNGTAADASNHLRIETDAANRTAHKDLAKYYLSVNPSSGANAQLTVLMGFVHIKWLQAVLPASSGSSDECIRFGSSSDDSPNCIVEKCWLSTRNAASQDCIYAGNWNVGPIFVFDTCTTQGGNSARSGIHAQIYNNDRTQTWRIEHCTVNANGVDNDLHEGGITARAHNAAAVANMHVWNCVVFDASGSAEDFQEGTTSGTINWTGEGNIGSDSSCQTLLGTTNNQNNAVVDTDNDSGTDVQITTLDEDYQIIDGADNGAAIANAQTGATRDSRVDTTVDIAGNSRPTYASGLRDSGAFQVASSGIELVMQEASHLHVADNVDLVQANILAMQEAFHLHAADNVDLVQANTLAVAEASHDHVADNVDLVQVNLLAVNEASHDHVADNVDLVQANVLTVAEASHDHGADNVDLVQANILAIAEAFHDHAADNIILNIGITLSVAEASHDHVADSVDLVQAHTIAVNEASHDHVADNVDLVQANILAVAEAFHDHAADNIVLELGLTLTVAEASHLHVADNVDLVQANILAPAEASHDHVADNVDLVQAHLLAVAEAFHDHVAGNIDLQVGSTLIMSDAAHDHITDNVDLVQANILAIDEAFHALVSDNADLIQDFALAIDEAFHAHVADNIVLFFPVATLPDGIIFDIDGKDRVFTIDGKDRVFIVDTKKRVFVVLPGNRVQ